MDRVRPAIWMHLLAGLAVCYGPGCRSLVRPPENPLPRVLPPSPTLEQIIQVVNNNSGQIQSFVANGASISGEGFPTLRAVLAFERPRRLRLRADNTFTGPELDLGSNDELFWFWVRRSQPPAVYYARHEQFAACPAQQNFPIRPEWLIEALGITQFDPSLPHQGPFPHGREQLEVRTIRDTPQGSQTKVTIVDSVRGCVLQQSIYDCRGHLLATSDSLCHRRDPLSGLIMPTVVTVRSMAGQLSMRLDLGLVEINRPATNMAPYWTAPVYEGFPWVDLCSTRPPGMGR